MKTEAGFLDTLGDAHEIILDAEGHRAISTWDSTRSQLQLLRSAAELQPYGTCVSLSFCATFCRIFSQVVQDFRRSSLEEVKQSLQVFNDGCKILMMHSVVGFLTTLQGQSMMDALISLCHLSLSKIAARQLGECPLPSNELRESCSCTRSLLTCLFRSLEECSGGGESLQAKELLLILLRISSNWLCPHDKANTVAFLSSEESAAMTSNSCIQSIRVVKTFLKNESEIQPHAVLGVDANHGALHPDQVYHIRCFIYSAPEAKRKTICDLLMVTMLGSSRKGDSRFALQLMGLLIEFFSILDGSLTRKCLCEVDSMTFFKNHPAVAIQFMRALFETGKSVEWLDEKECRTMLAWCNTRLLSESSLTCNEEAASISSYITAFTLRKDFKICRTEEFFSCLLGALSSNNANVVHRSVETACEVRKYPSTRDFMLENCSQLLVSVVECLSFPGVALSHGSSIAALLAECSYLDHGNIVLARRAEIRDAMVSLATQGPVETREGGLAQDEMAKRALLSLSSNPLNRRILANHCGILKTLIDCLRSHTSGRRGKKFLNTTEQEKLRSSILELLHVA